MDYTNYIYQVVGDGAVAYYTAPQLLVRYPNNGMYTTKEKHGHLREELIYQPILEDMCGPMYNGTHEGKTCIRYETWEAYEIYSR